VSDDQQRSDPEVTRLDSGDMGGKTDADLPSPSPVTKRLGDFELLREIGRGGMGVVYEARQISLNRRVALKVLPPGLGLTEQAVKRFEREAQAAAKLHHTNIVPVHAIGQADGSHFYAMELIEGQPLSEVLRDLSGKGSNPLLDETVTKLGDAKPLTKKPETGQADSGITSLSDTQSGSRKWFDAVAKLVAEVADALEYAHGRGVIHRDIKPANLMLSKEGRLCVTDFGLARVAQEPGMTISGSLLGTPAYMSPEQITAGRVKLDHRTDVYSLGVVLYEMLAQRRPFPGDNREAVLSGILTKDPRPPRRFNPRVPLDLETIALKAMEKDPDRRYATAGELAQDLKQYLGGGLITARRAGIARRTWKSIRRHPTAALAVVGVLIVVSVAVVALQVGGRGEAAQRLVADARLALREGTYRDGLQFIDRAVALDPDSIEARLVRARLLVWNVRMRDAADEARSVLQTEPQNYSAHAILAGLALYPNVQYRLVSIDPEPHLRVVEASAPENAEAYYLRALRTKDTRRQIELLDRALDLNPGYQLASETRANALGGLKDFQLMLSEADRLITARPESAQGWRFKSSAYQGQRDFENARTAIERAMEIDDLDPWNYVQRSWILWGMGKQDEALSDLARAIELDPEHAFLYCNRAERLNSMGRFEEAIADARRSIELNPDDRFAYRQLFQALLSTVSVETVQAIGEPEVEVGPDAILRAELEDFGARADGWFDVEAKAWAYRTIGDYYRKLKDHELAMKWVERGIEADPDDFWGLIFRRRIHKALGDDAAAAADCDAAARIDIDEPNAMSNRAYHMVFDCGRQEQAIADFTRIIELVPKWSEGFVGRGTAQLMLQRHEDALADLNNAIELAPLDPRAYTNRAIVYGALHRRDEQLADLRKSLELNPHSAIGWLNYGIQLFNDGRVAEALEQHDRAIELNPRYTAAHAERANMLAWLGRCDEAATALARAEEVYQSGSPQSSWNIAAVHYSGLLYNCPEQSNPDLALGYARVAYEARPERHRTGYAEALFHIGDYAEARQLYTEAYEKDPEGGWLYLAMCHWHLGNKTEARKLYEQSVTWMEENFPRSPLLKPQRQEAAELLGIQP
jgi:serine/threonine protein kinase/Tfp pilus assembly protein PilF